MADDAAVPDEQLQQEVAQRAIEVDSFLKKKDKMHALQKCLENPPVSSKSQDIKVRSGVEALKLCIVYSVFVLLLICSKWCLEC